MSGIGFGAHSPTDPTRKRIPFVQALGTEQQLKDGEWVWVIFADAIARVRLEYDWIISRRGPRLLDQMSAVPTHDGRLLMHHDHEWTPKELLVFTRDGVLSLQRREAGRWSAPGTIVVDPEMIAAEQVDDTMSSRHGQIEIVRVLR